MKKIKLILTLITSLALSLLMGAAIEGSTGNTNLAIVSTLALFAGSLVIGNAYVNEPGMAYACGSIAANITTTCANVPTAGIEVDIYIWNRADFTYTIDGANPVLCTAITPVAAAVAYKYTGIKKIGSMNAKTNQGDFLNNFIHGGEIIILQKDPTTKKEIDQLPNANVVIMVKNKAKGATGNMKYEIYGREVGLEAQVETNTSDAATGGGYKLIFSSPKDEFENHLPTTFFVTDETTTDAAAAALLV
jgi:hypothetical protein